MEGRVPRVKQPDGVTWAWKRFKDLSATQCYKLLQLRAQVFVEEQGYAYNDLDGLDYNALHLLAFDTSQKNLIASARLIFPEVDTVEVSRVVVHEDYRKLGIGSALMNEVLNKIDKQYPHYRATLKVGIDKNYHSLPKFYKKFGFELSENQQPMIHANYVYKNFDFPTLELARPAQHQKVETQYTHIKNQFLRFFKHAQPKEKFDTFAPSIKAQPF